MKKVFSICVVTLGLLLITGCGIKKESGIVKCSSILDGNPFTVTTNFNENKMTEVVMESSIKIPDDATEEDIINDINISSEYFNKLNGVNAVIKKRDSYLDMSIKLDIDKISQNTLKQLGYDGLFDSSMSMKEYKKRLENNGYVCE